MQPVSGRAIMGIVSLSCAMTGLFVANIFLTIMIGEINRKRPDGNLISYFGFAFTKMLRIFSEYRGSYPQGKIHLYSLLALALAVAGLIGVAACLGFFR